MDLVIKISDKCNFACEFCSSNMIATSHDELELSKVTAFLYDHTDVRNIIVNGGDPLCVNPEWYYNLIGWTKENDREGINISFTTNLWDFYKHPAKWEDLFKNYVSVCTSFQYGNERKVADGTIFTEDLFTEIFNMFEERIGYKLKYIAVQNHKNASYALATVELAKRLGTTCRINPALRSGRTDKPYPFHLMMKTWLDIMSSGLGEYEDNCKLIKDAWNQKVTECPFNNFCHESIRCMSPDGTVHNCPAIADDILKGVDEAYIEDSNKVRPYKDIVIQPECYQCPCFNICNSCTKRIIDIHDMGENYLKDHCKHMKILIPRMEELCRYTEQ